MNSFYYSVPTNIYFGKDSLTHLPDAVIEFGCRVLLVYGGGSIKKSGLYDKVTNLLKENHIEWVDLAGVEPNPRVTTVEKGVAMYREHRCNVVLAVGGGSTIDCSKVIAACVNHEGNAWDFVTGKVTVEKVEPIISVLTLAATGSEMNSGAVISNMETNDKIGVAHVGMKPKYSFLNPENTYSVNTYQTAAGTADIMSHIMEIYFSRENFAISDRLAESLLKVCIKYGPIALKEPNNYEARANLMWASSLALNGLLACGKGTAWSVHSMEHQLSAYYDITHGVGLAMLTPNWMRHILDEDAYAKFYEFGVNVWGIDPILEEKVVANKAIDALEEFFLSLQIPMRLQKVGINEEKLEIMAEKAANPSLLNAYRPLKKEDVLAIYKKTL